MLQTVQRTRSSKLYPDMGLPSESSQSRNALGWRLRADKRISEHFAVLEKHTLYHLWPCFTLDIENGCFEIP